MLYIDDEDFVDVVFWYVGLVIEKKVVVFVVLVFDIGWGEN